MAIFALVQWSDSKTDARSASRALSWGGSPGFAFGAAALWALTLGTAPAAGEPARDAWSAPVEFRDQINPVKPTAESVDAGRVIYMQNCQGCHGAEGRGDGPAARALKMDARDLTDRDLMGAAADGELFWKIATGRAPMNAFSPHLSDEEIWSVVNFLRTLDAPDAGGVRTVAYVAERRDISGRAARAALRLEHFPEPARRGRFHWVMVFGSLFFAGGFVSMMMDRSMDPRII